jgi:hypothetical protein
MSASASDLDLNAAEEPSESAQALSAGRYGFLLERSPSTAPS